MHSTYVLGEAPLVHHRRMQWREAGRDGLIVALCIGTVDFVDVFGGAKIFWSEGGWLALWASIIGLNLIGIGIGLVLLRPLISASAGLWAAWFVVIGAYGAEWVLRDAAPFTDNPLVEQQPNVDPVAAPIDPEMPNVLLISVDTLRSDYVGAWGNRQVKTPQIDALAQSGVRFTSAFAPIAVTGPSHAAMLTGAGPWTSGMLLNGVTVPPTLRSLAPSLRAAGYRTGAFVSAVVLDGSLGFDRGFEVYDYATGEISGLELSRPGRVLSMIRRFFQPHAVLERRGDATTNQALRWISGVKSEPFFAWVHLFDPHGPYTPPSPWSEAYYEGDPRDLAHTSMDDVSGVADYLKESLVGIQDVQWVMAQYAGEVSFVDAQIGRLMAALEAGGLGDNTLVVMVGDHGESFGEGGVWFNHGGDLDESAIRVPMIIRWPKRLAGGVEVTDPVGVVDVAPTIWGLLGLPSDAPDGFDLLGAAQGEVKDRPGVMSLCYDRTVNQQERVAGRIQSPTYVLARMWSASGWFQIGSHISRGAIVHGEVEGPAMERVAVVVKSIGDQVHRRSEERGEATLEQLKALGYVE
jgi:arylsulfatase A-like enzyme